MLLEFVGDTNVDSSLDVVVFVREVVESFPHLRASIVAKLCESLDTIRSSKVRPVVVVVVVVQLLRSVTHSLSLSLLSLSLSLSKVFRASLWIIAEYAVDADELSTAMAALKDCLVRRQLLLLVLVLVLLLLLLCERLCFVYVVLFVLCCLCCLLLFCLLSFV